MKSFWEMNYADKIIYCYEYLFYKKYTALVAESILE